MPVFTRVQNLIRPIRVEIAAVWTAKTGVFSDLHRRIRITQTREAFGRMRLLNPFVARQRAVGNRRSGRCIDNQHNDDNHSDQRGGNHPAGNQPLTLTFALTFFAAFDCTPSGSFALSLLAPLSRT